MGKLTAFLQNHKARGEGFTHTSMKGGKYYVESEFMEEFFKIYKEDMVKGVDLHITEHPYHYSPMLIDLDFRFPIDKKTRQYDLPLLKEVMNTYLVHIRKFVDIGGDNDNDGDIVVMEKGNPVVDEKKQVVKDGVHIVIPSIPLDFSVQQLIRESCLDDMKKVLDPLKCLNSIEDIVDHAVIDKNNWFMYGSKKPDNTSYKVTHHWDLSLSEKPHLSESEYVEFLALRNVYDKWSGERTWSYRKTLINGEEYRTTNTLNEEKYPVIRERMNAIYRKDNPRTTNATDKKRTDTKKVKDTECNTECNTDKPCDDDEDLREVMMKLDVKRSDDYHLWYDAIMVIKNSATDDLKGLEIAEAFSKRCPHKFDIKGLHDVWENADKNKGLHPNPLSFGSAVYWLKEDNLEEYENRRKRRTTRWFMDATLDLSDYSMACLFHHLYPNRFVVIQHEKSVEWLEYKEHRWYRRNDNILKKLFATEVVKLYEPLFKKHKANFDDLHARSRGDDSLKDEMHTAKQKMETYEKIIRKLKSSTAKENYVKECKLLYEEDVKEWYQQLDESHNLIGFNNGVYDLDEKKFRDGKPTDMLTFTTGYDYTEEVNDAIRKEILNVYTSMFPNEALCNYHLSVIAYCLHGNKYAEEMWLLTGKGGNGKGLQDEFNKLTFGDYYYSPSIQVFTQKQTSSSGANSEIARAKGKRILVSTEPEADDKLQASRIKQMSGNDLVQARALYREFQEFLPQFAVLLQMNAMPIFAGTMNAETRDSLARRLRVIEFMFNFVNDPKRPNEKKVDKTLKRKITTDVRYRQQFMLLLLEYYYKYVSGQRTIEVPKEVAEFTRQYFENQDSLSAFFAECLEHTGNRTDTVKPTDLYEHYASSEHYDRSVSQRKFGLEATKVLQNSKDGGVKMYRGYKLRKDTTTNFKDEGEDEEV